MNRLLRTTAIRTVLRYTVLYGLITGVGLGVLYWATSRYVDAQISTGLKNELSSLIKIDREQGRKKLLSVINGRQVVNPENHYYHLLVTASGKKLAGDLSGWPPQLQADTTVRNIWIDSKLIPYQMQDYDGFWPMIATTLKDGSRLLIAQSVRQAEDLQEFILGTISIILLVIVGLTLALGWRMGRQILNRVDSINNAAGNILQGDLTARIPEGNKDDEFTELARHLNHMLMHIEKLVNGMREVTDNVAHDLRRPLSRLRNRLELTLLERRREEEYRHTMEDAIGDVDSMIRTFNDVLEIAQAEAGSYRGEWETVNFSALATDIGLLYKAQAEVNQQSMILSITPDIHVPGNRHLLGQLISNLLENAYKYAGDNALITLQLGRKAGHTLLTVSDTGPGMPETQMQRVLQRFVRLDNARSTPGNGLGLSLVQAVAQLHKAKLSLSDNHPGLRVTVCFETSLVQPTQDT